MQHFFDGLGMLHKFRMTGGRVYYSSRHTAEGVVRNAKKNGYVSTLMFGLNANTPLKDAQDPCSALLGAQVCRIHLLCRQERYLTDVTSPLF